MAILHPFRAVRPARDKAHLVATRPVYTYKKSILKAKLEANPYTFIRIINPEYNEVIKTKPNSLERFKHVKLKFEEFYRRKILIQDENPALYLYRQTIQGQEFVGIIAGASNDEYRSDHIKKHEATLTSRELMFTNYLDTVGFNAEPVLLSYPKNNKLKQSYARIMKARPEYEFSTTDKIKHELWVVSPEDEQKVQKLFDKIEYTYIADGHHRSASSVRLENTVSKKEKKQFNNLRYFLACFMDEESLKILEFNRLVKSLGKVKPKDLLLRLKDKFEIKQLSQATLPQKEHQIVMNLKNKWYQLDCKNEIIENGHPVSCLDAEILTQEILKPILGIQDLKTDANIDFVSGNLGLKGIVNPIKKGKAQLGFILFPTTMTQIKRVADHHMIMPPKSTWVEPKMRSGLTIYNIRE